MRNSWNFYELKFFHWINNSFFSKTQIFQGICSPSSAHLKEFIGIFIFIPRSPVFMVAHQIVTQTCGVSLHVPKLTYSSKYWGFWRLTYQENHCIFTVFVHYFISFLNTKIEKVVDVFMNTKGAQVVKKEMLSKYGQYILSSTNIAIKIS